MMSAEVSKSNSSGLPTFPIPAHVIRMIEENVARDPGGVATQFKRGGSWQQQTWAELFSETQRVGFGLMALDAAFGDRIVILSATRIEHVISDLGILCAGAITVPIYHSLTADEVRFIVEDSGATLALVENEAQLAKLREVRDRLPALRKLVLMEGEPDPADGDWVISFSELQEMGDAYGKEHPGALDERLGRIEADTPASLLYTSGTTGDPKGVVLTHSNWCYEAAAVARLGIIESGETILLFLPLAHSFAKVVAAAWMHLGAVLAIAESVEKVVDNAQEVKPHVLPSAPRIFEKVYSAVVGTGTSAPGLKGALFRWAMGHYDRYVEEREQGKEYDSLGWRIARSLVFSKVAKTLREDRLGGRLRVFVSGSAPLANQVAYFFDVLGFTVLEGYGLTETSAATCVNLPGKNKIGTVGPPIPRTEIRIADDGEILVRGGGVMKGYYNRPEETAEVLTEDGWLHTGDIGSLDEDGYLRITDRKKDIIVTAGGKNVAPQKIENALKAEPLVSQAMVYGDKRKYLVALITIDEERARALLTKEGVAAGSYEEMARHPKIHEAVEAVVERTNAGLPSYETIKKFIIPTEDFTQESGDLTPTLKVKRRVTTERYRKQLDALYDERFD